MNTKTQFEIILEAVKKTKTNHSLDEDTYLTEDPVILAGLLAFSGLALGGTYASVSRILDGPKKPNTQLTWFQKFKNFFY